MGAVTHWWHTHTYKSAGKKSEVKSSRIRPSSRGKSFLMFSVAIFKVRAIGAQRSQSAVSISNDQIWHVSKLEGKNREILISSSSPQIANLCAITNKQATECFDLKSRLRRTQKDIHKTGALCVTTATRAFLMSFTSKLVSRRTEGLSLTFDVTKTSLSFNLCPCVVFFCALNHRGH